MTIKINGTALEDAGSDALISLLRLKGIAPEKVLIEINGQLLADVNSVESAKIKNGDEINIYGLVAGG